MRGPVRTCVGCGERAVQAVLLRMVTTADGLRLDRARRAPGRGAYLHDAPVCWAEFARRRGRVRSLRRSPGAAERGALVATLLGAAGEDAR